MSDIGKKPIQEKKAITLETYFGEDSPRLAVATMDGKTFTLLSDSTEDYQRNILIVSDPITGEQKKYSIKRSVTADVVDTPHT